MYPPSDDRRRRTFPVLVPSPVPSPAIAPGRFDLDTARGYDHPSRLDLSGVATLNRNPFERPFAPTRHPDPFATGEPDLPDFSSGLPRAVKRVLAGQRGAKRLSDRFGGRLLCVRYRRDDLRGLRLTTAEIVIAISPIPRRPAAASPKRPPAGTEGLVGVRVMYRETALRERLLAAGGRWNPELRLWLLPRAAATKLGLQNRIQPLPRVTKK